MKYYLRTSVSPDDVIAAAPRYFAGKLAPTVEENRHRRFSGTVGELSVTVRAEGGHYTLVTIETNQPAESEIDRLGKRFLGTIHTMAKPGHQLRGAY